MKKPTKKQLLDLAADVKKAAYLEFYIGSDDRMPDGDRLDNRGKEWIEKALTFQAENDATLRGNK